MILLLACASSPDLDTAAPMETAHAVTSYNLDWTTDPDPLLAGEAGLFTLQITDQDGHPIED